MIVEYFTSVQKSTQEHVKSHQNLHLVLLDNQCVHFTLQSTGLQLMSKRFPKSGPQQDQFDTSAKGQEMKITDLVSNTLLTLPEET